jgi:hypothetical protein
MQHTLEKREVYTQYSWETEGKRPLGRTRHTSEDNIKIGLKGIR